MSNKTLISVSVVGALTLFALWLSPYNTASINSNEIASTPIDQPNKEQTQLSKTEQAHVAITTNHVTTPNIPSVEEISSSANIAQQVEDALIQFDETSQYPPHSQPITRHNDVNSFVNLGLPHASQPFPFDDLDTPIQLSIDLNKNNYFYGDFIEATVTYKTGFAVSSANVRTVLMSINGDVLAESSEQENFEDTTVSIFDTQTYNANNWPIEMNIAAYVTIDGRNLFISAPFKINTETASLDSIGFSEPAAENLVIPVNFNVKIPGYYYIAGILHSQTTHKPLIHLEAEGFLKAGQDSLTLKAHIKALKKTADEGPYYLSSIRIERWSDEVIQHDIAGKVGPKDYLVEGYSFNDFEDKDYIDPLTEERQRLLQGLNAL
jgi:hypothetical protein